MPYSSLLLPLFQKQAKLDSSGVILNGHGIINSNTNGQQVTGFNNELSAFICGSIWNGLKPPVNIFQLSLLFCKWQISKKLGFFKFLMPFTCFLERLQVAHAHIKHRQVPKGRYFFAWETAGLPKQKPYHCHMFKRCRKQDLHCNETH